MQLASEVARGRAPGRFRWGEVAADRRVDSAQIAAATVDDGARDHVRAITLAAQSSFFWAMRLLPKERREAMFAIYAFCREVDDIADGDAPFADKMARLGEWRAEIGRLFDGRPEQPTARALARAVADYRLAREDFLAVIEGMEMDVRGEMRAPDLARLDRYCDCVAGAVGLLSIRVFGATQPRARDFALALGGALQRTNILRDLAEDAALGRLYLPRELLSRHGVAARTPAEALAHPALSAVCRDFAELALGRFREAERALADCPGRALRPAVVMMVVYRRILERMRRAGWSPGGPPVGLTKPEKLWIAFRYGIL
jgi:phytoene synthase